MKESVIDGIFQWAVASDAIEDCIFILDSDMNITSANKSMRAFLGKEKEELVGKHCWEIIRSLAALPDFCSMNNMTNGKRRKSGIIDIDGKFFKITVDPILDEVGSTKGAIVLLRDIDESEKAKRLAEDNARKYRELVETMNDVTFTLDFDGVVIDTTQSMEKIIGFSRLEAIGRRFSEFVYPDDLQRAEEEFLRAIQGIGHPLVIRITTRDGNIRWVWINALLIMRNGEPEELLCVLSDITEKKKDESLLALQSDVLTILTRSSNTHDAIEGIVHAIKQCTGFDAVGIRLHEGGDYPLDAAVGYTDEFLNAENTLAIGSLGGGICQDKGGNIILECTCGLVISGKTDPANPLFTPGGSAWTNDSLPLLHVPPEQDIRLQPRNRCIHAGFRSIALVPLRAEDKIVGLIHLASRLTDCFTEKSIKFFEGIGISIGVAIIRKRTEELLIESQEKYREDLEKTVAERTSELKLSNEELESFVYSVSHDLRAPLRSIDGFSQAVMEDYADKLDAQGQDYLNLIRDSIQRMGKIIDEMLILSRITRAGLKLDTVNLSTIADNISNELKESDPHRNVVIVIKPNLEVRGDREMMRVLMENLMRNAWKFTSRHDSARIDVGVDNGNGGTSICVRDDGAGFDMKFVDKLFTPFQRLHSASEFPGTGIGLATVKRIVTKHGGNIWAEGAVEKGAAFHFTIGPEGHVPSEHAEVVEKTRPKEVG